ncbi:MAG: DUF3365 domain-containing protein [Cytophagales bacterium]|nr:DUF3365 domain-containing protein [Cytophagales bacterium]
MRLLSKSILPLLASLLLFSACHNKRKSADAISAEDSVYMKKGDQVTKMAQAVLLSRVAMAMKEGGPPKAINVCSVEAESLLDSLSKEHECSISRISLKNRNPKAYPASRQEKEALLAFDGQSGKQPRLVRKGHELQYFKPIYIAMPACLKCHGTEGADIEQATLRLIKEKYPKDRARGYENGDFRGAWKLSFQLSPKQ